MVYNHKRKQKSICEASNISCFDQIQSLTLQSQIAELYVLHTTWAAFKWALLEEFIDKYNFLDGVMLLLKAVDMKNARDLGTLIQDENI